MYKTKNHPLLFIAILLHLGIRLPFSSSGHQASIPLFSAYFSFAATAMRTFSSMRNYNLVPEFPCLLHHFNSAGLLHQEKVKEFVAEQVQESEEGIAMDSNVSGAFVKIGGKKQEFCYGSLGTKPTSRRSICRIYKHKRKLGKECH